MEVISLSNIIKATDEEGEVYNYLSSFLCSKDKNIEEFLHRKAVNNEKRSFGRTNLIINNDGKKIMGYFTMMIKDFIFDSNVSKTTRKSLAHNKNASHFNSILIAQLGKSDQFKSQLSGATILDAAIENCKRVYDLTGLQIVCVEYSPLPKLIQFYQANQFKALQTNPTGYELSFLKLS